MRVAILAGVGSFSLLLAACDTVENPTPPERQAVRLHVAGALKVRIRDLGTLDGGTFSTASAINRWGQVVGYSSKDGGGCGGPAPNCRAFLWDATEGMQDLGAFGSNFSRALDINDAGQIAGTTRISFGAECEQLGPITSGCRAFLWENGTMHNLGTLPGGDFSAATDITEIGHVVGFSTTASGETHAFYWDGITMHDVGTLGGDRSLAWAANDRGRVVGVSTTASGEFHAFVWDYQRKRIRDLGTLGGTTSQAYAVNGRGDVAGYAYTEDGKSHAFFWDGWTMRDLGTIDGGEESIARAINRWGDVVGSANSRPGGIGDPHPFIWNGSHGMRDLGTLGGVDGHAYAINNLTEVVGNAGVPEFGSCTAIGGCHAFFWDGVMHDLGHLGFPSSVAVDLNTRGQIVGSSEMHPCETCSRQTRAVLWTVRY